MGELLVRLVQAIATNPREFMPRKGSEELVGVPSELIGVTVRRPDSGDDDEWEVAATWSTEGGSATDCVECAMVFRFTEPGAKNAMLRVAEALERDSGEVTRG